MAKFYVKLALLVLLTGLVLVIIGQATSYWQVRSGHHRGLWRYCYDGAKGTKDTTCKKLDLRADFDTKVWAPRILNILACIASFISLLLLVVYLRRNDGSANLRRIKAVIGLCVACAIFVFVGIAVYASKKHGDTLSSSYHYGWSFIVTVVAGGLHLLVILGLFFEVRTAATLGAYESI